MMAGARCRSSMVSNSGTIGRVQLSTPGVSAKSPAVLASRYAPSTSLTLRVMLSTKVPNASRSISSRSRRTSWNMPSVSARRPAAAPAAPRPAASGRASSRGDPGAPRLGPGLGRVAVVAAGAPEIAQRGVELGGVLPDVEPDGAEAERLHFAAHRPHQRRARSRSGRPALELVLDQLEVGEQRVGRGVAGRVRAGCRPARWRSIITWSRRSMQARYWRKTSPGLRAAISSPLAASRRAPARAPRGTGPRSAPPSR